VRGGWQDGHSALKAERFGLFGPVKRHAGPDNLLKGKRHGLGPVHDGFLDGRRQERQLQPGRYEGLCAVLLAGDVGQRLTGVQGIAPAMGMGQRLDQGRVWLGVPVAGDVAGLDDAPLVVAFVRGASDRWP